MTTTDPQTRIADEIAAALEADPTASHTLTSLAEGVGFSRGHVQRLFTARFGMSPAAYLRSVRAGRLREGLRGGEPVARAGYDAGFGSDRAIYEQGTRTLGMAPSRYRRHGAGLTITVGIANTRFGRLVIGVTDRGVCCALFDDGSGTELVRAEFPSATVLDDAAAIAEELRAVTSLLDGDAAADVPLDLIGTPFQRRVWAELRRIPAGETASYAEVARRLGEPRATRAVAGACASNHVAVVVPCHRVVRTDGGLGGYRWGVERKRRLLSRETAPR
jgi:AraC family transcriptional regulator of adaptative response/methylated-DNA-[protein]-cysteine methyltransferase